MMGNPSNPIDPFSAQRSFEEVPPPLPRIPQSLSRGGFGIDLINPVQGFRIVIVDPVQGLGIDPQQLGLRTERKRDHQRREKETTSQGGGK